MLKSLRFLKPSTLFDYVGLILLAWLFLPSLLPFQIDNQILNNLLFYPIELANTFIFDIPEGLGGGFVGLANVLAFIITLDIVVVLINVFIFKTKSFVIIIWTGLILIAVICYSLILNEIKDNQYLKHSRERTAEMDLMDVSIYNCDIENVENIVNELECTSSNPSLCDVISHDESYGQLSCEIELDNLPDGLSKTGVHTYINLGSDTQQDTLLNEDRDKLANIPGGDRDYVLNIQSKLIGWVEIKQSEDIVDDILRGEFSIQVPNDTEIEDVFYLRIEFSDGFTTYSQSNAEKVYFGK